MSYVTLKNQNNVVITCGDAHCIGCSVLAFFFFMTFSVFNNILLVFHIMAVHGLQKLNEICGETYSKC